MATELAAELETVHPRHQDVENGDIGEIALESLPCVLAVAVQIHVVALTPQRVRHRLPEVLLVVDDGDGTHVLGHVIPM